MSIPRYLEYKDSHIRGVGELPAHWDVSRSDKYTDCPIETVTVDGFQGRQVFHYSIPVVQSTGTGQVEDGDEIDSSKSLLRSPRVLVSKLNPRKGTVCIATPHPELLTLCSGEFIPIVPRAGHLKYLHYSVQCEVFRQRLESRVESATRSHQRVNPEDIRKFWWGFPPDREQEAIAHFLDHQTAKIDALIQEQQRLIEFLKEKRQAVISHAVTKGLDRSVPMKNSGVEWLGEVPEHWEITKFGYISMVVRGGSPRPAGDPALFNGSYSPWVTVAEITKDDQIYLTNTESFLTKKGSDQCRIFRKGTLLISNSGATLGVPKILSIDANANDGVVGFENLAIDIEFAYFYLGTLTAILRERVKQGSGQPNLNTEIIKSIEVPVPPLTEIGAVVAHVRKIRERYGKLTCQALEATQLLQERRSALISAAVTGKIDVRNWKPPADESAFDEEVRQAGLEVAL